VEEEMKKIIYLLILVVLLGASTTFAQEKKKDDTGTNPVNFTYDFRLYQEMQKFSRGQGSQNRSIMELRAPLGRDVANVLGKDAGFWRGLGSQFALRFRGYYNTVTLNDNSAAGSTTYSGIGDFDARALWMAYGNSSFALAPGLEAFFNTATNGVGSGSTILAPTIFFGFFNLIGNRSIFAPGFQYHFSVDGKTVSRTVIDLYFVWILGGGTNWLIVNPQPIFDHHNETEFAQIDLEWGFMIVPKSGISGYIRPGIGVGRDRPFDYNFEFALKFIWR
jgi:hypothetical protein